MKGITFKILNALREGVINTADLTAVILESGYGASYKKLSKNLEKRKLNREQQIAKTAELQIIYNTLYRLKRSGLIESSDTNLSLTIKGNIRLKKFEGRSGFEERKSRYTGEASKELIIFGFDIPEVERHKRDWLRVVLSNLDFRMLQRSVWIGNVKLPEALVNDLKRFRMLRYIEVLAVSKTGTIKDYKL